MRRILDYFLSKIQVREMSDSTLEQSKPVEPSLFVDEAILKPYTGVQLACVQKGRPYSVNHRTYYYEDNPSDDYTPIEFQLYASKINTLNNCLVPSDDSDNEYINYSTSETDSDQDDASTKELKISIQTVSNGVVVNSNVFLTHEQWHTIVVLKTGMLKCVLCQRYVEPGMAMKHMKDDFHRGSIYACKPLAQFDLSIVREICSQYHCGVCNEEFSIYDEEAHFSSQSHGENLLTAINKVYDIELSKNNDKNTNNDHYFNANAINDNCRNENNGNGNKNNENFRSENDDNGNTLNDEHNDIGSTSLNNNRSCRNENNDNANKINDEFRNENYDNGNTFNDELTEIGSTTLWGDAQPTQTSFTYANMLKKPDFIEKIIGNIKIKVKLDCYHMIIKFKKTKNYYCMACKIFISAEEKGDHCSKDKTHLDNLEKCTVDMSFGNYFIRVVDDKFYHCGQCNNLFLKNDIEEHLRTNHGMKTRPMTLKDKNNVASNLNNDVKRQQNRAVEAVGNKGNDCKNKGNVNKNESNDSKTKSKVNNTKNDENKDKSDISKNKSNGSKTKSNISKTKGDDITHKSDNSKNNSKASENNIVSENNTTAKENKSNDNSKSNGSKNNSDVSENKSNISKNGRLPPERVAINVFGFKISVHLTAYHVIFKWQNFKDMFCGICEVYCMESAVPQHMNSMMHIQLLQRTPFISEFGTHLVRALRLTLHCAICNVPVTPQLIYVHLHDAMHIRMLNQALTANNAPNSCTNNVENETTKEIDVQATVATFVNDKLTEKTTAMMKDIAALQQTTSTMQQATATVQKTNSTTQKTTSTIPNLNNSFDEMNLLNASTESDEFDLEDFLYVKLKEAYFKISITAFNTLVNVGDGSRLCFVCGMKVFEEEIKRHVESRQHSINMKDNKFVDKYSNALLRQMYLKYHCSVCNVLMSHREVKNHLTWPYHKEETDLVKSITKKQRKNDLKYGKTMYVAELGKEMIYSDKENQTKVRISFKIKRHGPQLPLVKRRKIVIVNSEVLTFEFDSWHSVTKLKGMIKCSLCQIEIREEDLRSHIMSDNHSMCLKKEFKKEYLIHLLRQINDKMLHCMICNNEVADKPQIIIQHIEGKRHLHALDVIRTASSQIHAYEDCDEDPLQL